MPIWSSVVQCSSKCSGMRWRTSSLALAPSDALAAGPAASARRQLPGARHRHLRREDIHGRTRGKTVSGTMLLIAVHDFTRVLFVVAGLCFIICLNLVQRYSKACTFHFQPLPMQPARRATGRDPRVQLSGVLGGVALRAAGQPPLRRRIELQAGPLHPQLCLQGQDGRVALEGLRSS